MGTVQPFLPFSSTPTSPTTIKDLLRSRKHIPDHKLCHIIFWAQKHIVCRVETLIHNQRLHPPTWTYDPEVQVQSAITPHLATDVLVSLMTIPPCHQSIRPGIRCRTERTSQIISRMPLSREKTIVQHLQNYCAHGMPHLSELQSWKGPSLQIMLKATMRQPRSVL